MDINSINIKTESHIVTPESLHSVQYINTAEVMTTRSTDTRRPVRHTLTSFCVATKDLKARSLCQMKGKVNYWSVLIYSGAPNALSILLMSSLGIGYLTVAFNFGIEYMRVPTVKKLHWCRPVKSHSIHKIKRIQCREYKVGRYGMNVSLYPVYPMLGLFNHSDTPVGLVDRTYGRGDRVRVIRGSLCGLEGEVLVSNEGQSELLVRLDILGDDHTVDRYAPSGAPYPDIFLCGNKAVVARFMEFLRRRLLGIVLNNSNEPIPFVHAYGAADIKRFRRNNVWFSFDILSL